MTKDTLHALQRQLEQNQAMKRDMEEFFSEWMGANVADRYFISQLNAVRTAMEACSWQLSGSSRKANTSAKALYNKILASCQAQVEESKQMRPESKSQQEELTKALKALATAIVGTGGQSSGPPPAPTYGQPGYQSTGSVLGAQARQCHQQCQ
jgi:hypothetical protein